MNVVQDPRKMGLGIESDDMKSLPYIPRATLTGMRAVIRGQTRGTETIMRTEQSRNDNDLYPTSHEENPEDIKMDYSISVRTDEVRALLRVKLLMKLADEHKPDPRKHFGITSAALCLG